MSCIAKYKKEQQAIKAKIGDLSNTHIIYPIHCKFIANNLFPKQSADVMRLRLARMINGAIRALTFGHVDLPLTVVIVKGKSPDDIQLQLISNDHMTILGTIKVTSVLTITVGVKTVYSKPDDDYHLVQWSDQALLTLKKRLSEEDKTLFDPILQPMKIIPKSYFREAFLGLYHLNNWHDFMLDVNLGKGLTQTFAFDLTDINWQIKNHGTKKKKAIIPDGNLQICNYCQDLGQGLKICSGCPKRNIAYCNEKCQHDDWKFHREICYHN
ncbi:MAG: zinc finger MYND domain-containing protein [Candidatus Roizmanbacteria bacterium]